MRCLSLWQPWASLIAAGDKKIETRSWNTTYRGPLAIHAAKRWTTEQYDIIQEDAFRWPLRKAGLIDAAELVNGPAPSLFVPSSAMPFGAIVAVGTLVDVLPTTYPDARLPARDAAERAFGDYAPLRFAWLLGDVLALPEPISYAGHQGLWTLEPSRVAAIVSQLAGQTGRR